LERAQRIDPHFQSAASDAKLAQYLNAQDNGAIPTGRYGTQDGVHVYASGAWSIKIYPLPLWRELTTNGPTTEALSQTEMARLALAVTVVEAYYGLALAQRKYATTQ
jgi:hypothetical protein